MEYIILLVSLFGIVYGANFLVNGAVAVARKFNVSDFVIGAVIVGVGTSMPEFLVSFIGALEGNADVAIGNVVGSNIFNVLAILGITAMLFPIAMDKANVKFEIPLCIGVSVLLTLLAFDFFAGGNCAIGRADGLILVAAFVGYMWYSFYKERKKRTKEKTVETDNTPMWLSVIKVTGGLTLLIISCDFFVDNAVLIAQSFGVNDAFISLTLIACGTSLPELAASVAAAIKKNSRIALGNIVGSNIFNITFILGLSSQVTPLTSAGITLTDYIVMIAAAVLLLLWGFIGRIGRFAGAVMFICFVIYNFYLITTQTV